MPKESNLDNVPEKVKKFYEKPATHKEAWENIQKLREIHDPEKKERVIIKLDDPREAHKFVYMTDENENKYVVALPIERYDRHYKIRDLEEKLLKRWGKGEKIKEVQGGGWISTRGERLIISKESIDFGEAPKEEVAEILKKAFPEIEVKSYPAEINIEDYINDREAILDIISIEPLELRNLPENFKKDKEVVLEAVKKEGMALGCVPETFKKDKEVVLEAVKNYGTALKYASKNLQRDKEVVLEAVKQNGMALQYASEDLQDNEEVVREAVRQNAKALEYASKRLQNDPDIIKIASQ